MFPDDLYIASQSQNFLYKYINGNQEPLYSTQKNPCAVWVSQDQVTVYTANRNDNTISIFRNGIRVNDIDVGNQPWGICEDLDGAIYCTNYKDNTVSKIEDGKVVATIQVDWGPRGICVDSDNSIWVSCYIDNTVCKIVNDKYVKNVEVALNPDGICCDPWDNIWVCCYGSNVVSRISKSVKELDVMVGQGPIACTTDSNGTLYVCNYLGDNIAIVEKVMDDDGTNGRIVVSHVDINLGPNSCSVDSDDYCYITSGNGNIITKIYNKTAVQEIQSCVNPCGYGDFTGCQIYNLMNRKVKTNYGEILDNLNNRMDQLQSEINENKEKIENLKNTLSSYDSKLDANTTSISELKNKIITLENKTINIENRFDSVVDLINTNNENITNIYNKLEDKIENVLDIESNIMNNIENNYNELKGDITDINNSYSELKNTITNINNSMEEVTNITNNISGMFASGEEGQVVKVSNEDNGLFADDNFYEINVFDNNNDIQSFKNSFNYDINMQVVFDTWQSNRSMNRSTIDLKVFTDASANNNFVQKNTKDTNWKYQDGYLVMSLNQTVYCTFISLSEYQATFSLEVLIQAIDVGDDDIVSIIFGYTEDSANNYYTLEYNITPNKQNQTIYASTITYNLAQNGSKLLLSQPLSSQYQNSNDRPFSKMKIEKRMNSIKVYRTYFYSTETECINAPYYYTGTYDYPSTKPTDWDEETYKRIGTMFGQSKIGFGTISWNCKFKVLSSTITELIGNSIIYNMANDSVQKYENSNWITTSDKLSNTIPNRVFLYNSYTSKLFYYYYKNKYIQIK